MAQSERARARERALAKFHAAEQRYRAELELEQRLRALAPKVLDCLERALDDPQQGPKVALSLLRILGFSQLRRTAEPDLSLYELTAELGVRFEESVQRFMNGQQLVPLSDWPSESSRRLDHGSGV